MTYSSTTATATAIAPNSNVAESSLRSISFWLGVLSGPMFQILAVGMGYLLRDEMVGPGCELVVSGLVVVGVLFLQRWLVPILILGQDGYDSLSLLSKHTLKSLGRFWFCFGSWVGMAMFDLSFAALASLNPEIANVVLKVSFVVSAVSIPVSLWVLSKAQLPEKQDGHHLDEESNPCLVHSS